jgi:hypothetical protein
MMFAKQRSLFRFNILNTSKRNDRLTNHKNTFLNQQIFLANRIIKGSKTDGRENKDIKHKLKQLKIIERINTVETISQPITLTARALCLQIVMTRGSRRFSCKRSTLSQKNTAIIITCLFR